ncbi:MAG: type II toxin-antitoxin system death-on-curing family toxin [bacterium]
MDFVYISIEDAIQLHLKTVEVSGGGATGQNDIRLLDGVLNNIQNDDYYPTFEEKLTHLFFSSNKFHCFQDGNKRIAITLGAQFLLINGYTFIVPQFIREMENISYHVAANRIDKELLKTIITEILNFEELSEETRLNIFNSISSDSQIGF